MKDLFGNEVAVSEFARTHADVRRERARKYSRPRGHAAPPGSGPQGETCGSCANCYRTSTGSKAFHKCKLVKPTHGPATDVRKRDLACSRWVKKDDPA